MVMTTATKFIIGAAIALFLVGSATSALFTYKQGIKRQAQLEYNQKQLETVIAEQKKFTAIVTDIAVLQQNIIIRMEEQNTALEKKLADLDNYLESPEVEKEDRPSSEILKRTIKELSGQKP